MEREISTLGGQGACRDDDADDYLMQDVVSERDSETEYMEVEGGDERSGEEEEGAQEGEGEDEVDNGRSLKTFEEHRVELQEEGFAERDWPGSFSSYLSSYPHPMDANFQFKLSSKRKFAMLHSELGEKIVKGNLYSHQKFVRQFLSLYDRLFLISEPGTGKTCSVVSFCEYVVRLKHYRIPNALVGIQKFVIVVRSAFQIGRP